MIGGPCVPGLYFVSCTAPLFKSQLLYVISSVILFALFKFGLKREKGLFTLLKACQYGWVDCKVCPVLPVDPLNRVLLKALYGFIRVWDAQPIHFESC
jgi:hypothetical protein